MGERAVRGCGFSEEAYHPVTEGMRHAFDDNVLFSDTFTLSLLPGYQEVSHLLPSHGHLVSLTLQRMG